MSHRLISKVSMGAFDRSVLDRACDRVGIPRSHYEPAPGYNIRGVNVVGHSVQFPGWDKRTVFTDAPARDAHTGKAKLDANNNPEMEVQAHYENWTPGAGYLPTTPLEKLQAEYNKILDEDTQSMVEETRDIARRNNQAAQVVEETAEGMVVLEIQLG